MIGQTVSHYRVIEKLGEGGMGVVYKAEDISLNRPVALKVLPPEIVAHSDRNERFIQEAQSASAINHPNIAQVYELGEHEGIHFIAMEFVEGKTLRQLVGRKKMELDKLLDYMIQASDALAKAHRKGIVHRDLKPENIMVNEDGHVKVLDFGLAKLYEQTIASSDAAKVATRTITKTDPGMIVGTPYYMSPEQTKGKAVDHRSDTFSLGVVIYEMATGERPFKGDSAVEVMSAILKAEPPAIASINEKVPLELQRIVHKSIAKRRNNRYQDIKDMWVDLRELRRGIESGSSPMISDLRRKLDQPVWRRPWVWAAAAGTVVILAVMAWMLVGGFGTASKHEVPSVAVVWFENLSGTEEDDYFVAGMTDELITELWKIGGLRVSTRDDIRPYKDGSVSPTEIGRALGFDYVLTGTIKRMGKGIRVTPRLIEASSGSLAWTERFEDIADNLFALQDEIALQTARMLRVRLSREEKQEVAAVPTESSEAYDHYLKGRHYYHQETIHSNELAAKEYQKALLLDPDYTLAMAGLADAYVQRYEQYYDYDEHWLDEAKRLIDRALKIDSSLAEAYKSLAESHIAEDNLSAALEAAEQAQRLKPDWDEPYVCLGNIYYNRGENRQALEMYESALEIRPSVEGLCGKGSILRKRGDFEEAQTAFEEAKALNSDHYLPYHKLASLHNWDLDDPEAAVEYWRKSIEVRPDLGETYSLLAEHFADSGKLAEGEQLLRGFLDSYPYNWTAYSHLFSFLAGSKGDYPAAMDLAEEAAARNPDRFWPHLFVAYSHAYGMRRDPEPDKAIAAIDRALELRPDSYISLTVAGDLYSLLERPDDALAYQERALELNPGAPSTLLSIAWNHQREGDFNQAAEYFHRAIRSAPGYSYAYEYLEQAMIPMGQFEEYLRLIEDAAEEYGEDDPSFFDNLGEFQRQAGEYQESIATFERALAIKEDDDLRFGLAVSLWLSGDTESALDHLRGLGRHWSARYTIFAILRSEGRHEEIEGLLAAIKKPDPKSYSGIDHWSWWAPRYYESMRRWEDAFAASEEAKASGELTWVQDEEMRQSWRLRMMGKISQSRELLENCIASCPAETRVDAHLRLASLEAAAGNLAAALKNVELAASIYRWEEWHLVFASRLLYAQGREQKATEKLRLVRRQHDSGAAALYYDCQLKNELGVEGESGSCWELTALRMTLGARSYSAYAGSWSAYRALCLARLGDREEARSALEWALKIEPDREWIGYLVAATYAQLGDSDRALQWLRTSVERGYQEFWWARVDPDLEPLRDDPRFKQIMSEWDARLRKVFS